VAAHRTDQNRIDPSEQIPEADLLEQQAPLDPTLIDDDHGWVDWADRAAAAVSCDEADRWEQRLPVPSETAAQLASSARFSSVGEPGSAV
jgi:hypothetical protein